jgi:hypothetical protein
MDRSDRAFYRGMPPAYLVTGREASLVERLRRYAKAPRPVACRASMEDALQRVRERAHGIDLRPVLWPPFGISSLQAHRRDP